MHTVIWRVTEHPSKILEAVEYRREGSLWVYSAQKHDINSIVQGQETVQRHSLTSTRVSVNIHVNKRGTRLKINLVNMNIFRTLQNSKNSR